MGNVQGVQGRSGVPPSGTPLGLGPAMAELEALMAAPLPKVGRAKHMAQLLALSDDVAAVAEQLVAHASAMTPQQRSKLYALRDLLHDSARLHPKLGRLPVRLANVLQTGDWLLLSKLRDPTYMPANRRLEWAQTLMHGNLGNEIGVACAEVVGDRQTLPSTQLAAMRLTDQPPALRAPGRAVLRPPQGPRHAPERPQQAAAAPDPRSPALAELGTYTGSKTALSATQLRTYHRNLRHLLAEASPEVQAFANRYPVQHTRTLIIDGRTYIAANHFIAGSFGKVRLALDADGQLVALKVLRLQNKPGAKTHTSRVGAVVREVTMARAAGASTAPSQVWISPKDKVFLVMPLHLVDMVEMWQARHPQKFLHLAALQAVLDVAADAAHAHAQGLTHCDIKLENVLLRLDGHFALADFGFAKEMDAEGRAPGLVATPMYLPPEQVSFAEPYTGVAADVWGLGLIWAQAAIGDALFDRNPGVTTTKQRIASVSDELAHYCAWHAQLPHTENGLIDEEQVLQANLLDLAYHKLVGIYGGATATFIFDQMLNPDPDQRPSMASVKDFCAELMEMMPGSTQAQGKLRDMGEALTIEYRATKLALQAHKMTLDTQGNQPG